MSDKSWLYWFCGDVFLCFSLFMIAMLAIFDSSQCSCKNDDEKQAILSSMWAGSSVIFILSLLFFFLYMDGKRFSVSNE
jgi:hypothetical protein